MYIGRTRVYAERQAHRQTITVRGTRGSIQTSKDSERHARSPQRRRTAWESLFSEDTVDAWHHRFILAAAGAEAAEESVSNKSMVSSRRCMAAALIYVYAGKERKQIETAKQLQKKSNLWSNKIVRIIPTETCVRAHALQTFDCTSTILYNNIIIIIYIQAYITQCKWNETAKNSIWIHVCIYV